MTRADNEEVQHIHDLKGKVIAAASISGLGSGCSPIGMVYQYSLVFCRYFFHLVFSNLT